MASIFYFILTLSAFVSSGYCLPTDAHKIRVTSTPTFPMNEVVNTGVAPLPTPTASPKYIGLGLGMQNFTCNATTNTFVSVGAVATLFDLYDGSTAPPSKVTIDKVSETYDRVFEICLITGRSVEACASVTNLALNKLPVLGKHYFASIGGKNVPTFDLSKFNDFLSSKKVGDVLAPADAYDGSNGRGAADWLYLASDGSSRTHGVSYVYRVETAGGMPPASCSAGATTQVPYAAEYWFYT